MRPLRLGMAALLLLLPSLLRLPKLLLLVLERTLPLFRTVKVGSVAIIAIRSTLLVGATAQLLRCAPRMSIPAGASLGTRLPLAAKPVAVASSLR